MAEEFDKHAAAMRHDDIIKEAQRIRNGITIDVIDYYFNRYPENEDDEKREREGMRKFLIIAQERIHDLLNGKLY